MSQRIAIIGAGGWGTALGMHLASAGHEVRLRTRSATHATALRETRENQLYLPGVFLRPEITITHSMEEALDDCDMAVVAVPSRAFRTVLCEVRLSGVEIPIVVSCTKGLDKESGLRMSQLIKAELPESAEAVLSGPSHAEEVARRSPTAVCVGAATEDVANQVQATFNHAMLRVYTTQDLPGMELGGALKNVYALAAGVCDGLGLGDNTKAALVTRSLAEMVRLGKALGGRDETFRGLSGIGDLMVTCFSRHSRNRRVGERLGQGETLQNIQESMQMVAEGVPTTETARAIAEQKAIETPMLTEVYAILFQNRKPEEALANLMTRAPKPEEN